MQIKSFPSVSFGDIPHLGDGSEAKYSLPSLRFWRSGKTLARAQYASIRDGGIPLFLARVEAVVATNERTVRTRGSNIHCKFA